MFWPFLRRLPQYHPALRRLLEGGVHLYEYTFKTFLSAHPLNYLQYSVWFPLISFVTLDTSIE